MGSAQRDPESGRSSGDGWVANGGDEKSFATEPF